MEKKADYYPDTKNINAENSRLEHYGSPQVSHRSLAMKIVNG
jgi:hypothetical protein